MNINNMKLDQNNFDTALLMAAGMGTRIRPISEETPKPLIPINGVPMIETIINGLKLAGVEHIFITVGYKKEKYYYLKDKYKNIEFIENLEYQSKNTISSFYAAMNYIQGKNCIISESDLYVADPTIFNGKMDKSRYMIRRVGKQDYEWGFIIEDDRIREVVRPKEGVFLDHHLYGIAYWIKDDLERLIESVKYIYDKPGSEKLAYDEAANLIFDRIDVGTIDLADNQVFEIDCLEDLLNVDESYSKYL